VQLPPSHSMLHVLPSAQAYAQPPAGHSNEHVEPGRHGWTASIAASPYGSAGSCSEAPPGGCAGGADACYELTHAANSESESKAKARIMVPPVGNTW